MNKYILCDIETKFGKYKSPHPTPSKMTYFISDMCPAIYKSFKHFKSCGVD